MQKQSKKPPCLFSHLGGKSRWTQRLLALFPEHVCYAEPFAGAASLFFGKERSPVEVLNDLDEDIVNFMRCLQERPWELVARLMFQPYSRADFRRRRQHASSVARAADWYFRKQASFGGRGPGHGLAASPVSNHAAPFTKHVSVLFDYALRLRNAVIEYGDFEEVIRRYDRPTTFFYCDPPYPDTTGYEHQQFNENDHRRLAGVLNQIEGRALVNYCEHKFDPRALPRLDLHTLRHDLQPTSARPPTTYDFARSAELRAARASQWPSSSQLGNHRAYANRRIAAFKARPVRRAFFVPGSTRCPLRSIDVSSPMRRLHT